MTVTIADFPRHGFRRPLPGGWGVANVRGLPGTFGCLLEAIGDPAQRFLLSASHVLAPGGCKLGDEIVNPADRTDRPVAHLAGYSGIHLTPDRLNPVDAAIARVVPGATLTRIDGIGLPAGEERQVIVGDSVQMAGATSGTAGPKRSTVKEVGWAGALRFVDRNHAEGIGHFFGQILCERFSAGGDSGAAVLNARGQVIGLVIGAAADAAGTVVTPIGAVLETMRVQGFDLRVATTPLAGIAE